MPKPQPNKSKKKEQLELGLMGEKFVNAYLTERNWQVLQERWHCRWGELDLVAYHPTQNRLIFVEVKTRHHNSLDQQGLLAITPGKQRKLVKAAAQFLGAYPQYMDSYCQFDVALVTYRRDKSASGFQLELMQYIAAAFEAEEF